LAFGLPGLVGADSSPPPVTNSWRLDPPSDQHAVEGYASQISVAPGENLELHVSTTPEERYRIEIYRIGWYGGSGGRLIRCLPSCSEDIGGQALPTTSPDPQTGENEAGWPVSDVLRIGRRWRSGYYLAKLVLTSGDGVGKSTGVPFIVRGPEGSRSAVLVVLPVNTWQAYNNWGGLSLYSDPRAAVRVSFDRPYSISDDQVILDYPIVRFIDQFGYDAEYVADSDVDADPGQLVRHRLVVVGAHSEYWTKATRDGFEAARRLGTNLAFLGGNTGFWQIRYGDPARRVLDEYRSAADPDPDPSQKTVRWRDDPVDRPECTLVGLQWQGGGSSPSDPGYHAYTVSAAHLSDPWFRHTGFKAGDSVEGAVSREWDSVAPECQGRTPPLTVLFHYEGQQTPQTPGYWASTYHSTNADIVRYEAPSGATVLSVGSIGFTRSLTGRGSSVADGRTPPDPRMQRFIRNAFAQLTQPRRMSPGTPAARPGGNR
jgi:N,N-dimethylformamidase beta subunit-like, C-terminal